MMPSFCPSQTWDAATPPQIHPRACATPTRLGRRADNRPHLAEVVDVSIDGAWLIGDQRAQVRIDSARSTRRSTLDRLEIDDSCSARRRMVVTSSRGVTLRRPLPFGGCTRCRRSQAVSGFCWNCRPECPDPAQAPSEELSPGRRTRRELRNVQLEHTRRHVGNCRGGVEGHVRAPIRELTHGSREKPGGRNESTPE